MSAKGAKVAPEALLETNAEPTSDQVVPETDTQVTDIFSDDEEKKDGEPIGETLDDIIAETRRIRKQNVIEDKIEHNSCLNFTIYIVFLILFFVETYLARGNMTAFYVSKILKDDILTTQWDQPAGGAKNFYDIANTGDIYDFLTYSLVPTFYAEQADNGVVLPDDYRYYYTSSKILGMRVRQLRVLSGNCDYPEEYDDFLTRKCWPEFDSEYEDTAPYVGPSSNATYTWFDAEETGEATFRGKLGSYPGGGYKVDLENNLTAALATVAQLRADNWIAEPTRMVLIETQGYNEAADLFISARILIEIPACGGYKPKAMVKAVKVPKFHTTREIALLVVDGLVLSFVIYFLVEELMEIRNLGCAYFKKVWNFIDIVNIAFFLSAFACRGAFFLSFSNLNPVENHPTYSSLSGMESMKVFENVFSAINAFLLWIKLFKYWQRNKRVMFLIRTVDAAKTELVYFMFIYMLFLFSFMHAGYLAFSTQVADFRSLRISFVTVFASLAGGASSPIGHMHTNLMKENSSIVEANRLYGYIFFMTFNVVVLIILTNLFLAILNKSYITTRDQLNREEAEERVRLSEAEEILSKEETGLFKKMSFKRSNTKKQEVALLEKNKAQEEADEEVAKAATKIQAMWRGKVARDLVLEIQISNRANQKAVDAQVKKLTNLANQLVAKIQVQKRKVKK